jgi:AMP nucleosidase
MIMWRMASALIRILPVMAQAYAVSVALYEKADIVREWLPRYTGTPVNEFGQFVLLANFIHYVYRVAGRCGVPVRGRDRPMQTATADDITIVNFGMGSAMAATIMDLLSAVEPRAALFLGKCGGLKPNTHRGDLILPIAAIRGEGTSDDYMPTEVPALPSFRLQMAVSWSIRKYDCDYLTGTVYTTNRRVWEHDADFKDYLQRIRAMGIDMETATLFMVGFVNKIPHGALRLVSANPMAPEGVKTEASDRLVTETYVERHLNIGVDALLELKNSGESVRHLRFD